MNSALEHVNDLLDFIDNSPSPWHAVHTIKEHLLQAGFQPVLEQEKWTLTPGGRYFCVRDDASIIAFRLAQHLDAQSAFKIIGAHTDSPGLRIKPNPIPASDGLVRLGVEVYGGPILATFADRDLSLAGRISYITSDAKITSRLIKFDQPVLRLPNLAIHMNRTVNDDGLKFNRQTELPLIFSNSIAEQIPCDYLHTKLLQTVDEDISQILSWELHVYDTQKGVIWGADHEFYANSQLDNLASCHAGLTALLQAPTPNSSEIQVLACFDHEEIGSCSAKGAESSFLPDILERIGIALNLHAEDYKCLLARSFMISADMAHAYQPNFPAAYEPEHKILMNRGPVVKLNVNQRYATESLSMAMFKQWCALAGVPIQTYNHRTDLACGSTIGPIISAKLGVRTVDVGSPMWAMHSCRESAGVLDHEYMIKALTAFYQHELVLA